MTVDEKGQYIHVFLRKKDNVTNPEAKLPKLKERNDDWDYELHNGGTILQLKNRIRFNPFSCMADVTDLVSKSGLGESWRQSHYVVKSEATGITEEDKKKASTC
ncbi:hypothetical protein FNYG_14866 [Fusarium nygamai]|uniref:Uncharacterized protein n=1 Tax=Gibberella nygamai TaxID=42673 RepID=A0A2K0UPE4_GIBNY|nr:hypothetical protein FNYG_14866 [Fusarium nygamai]